MNRNIFIAFMLATAVIAGCSKQQTEAEKASLPPAQAPQQSAPPQAPATDKAMADAINEARATVDEFIKVLLEKKSGANRFAVKAEVRDGDKSERFWLANVKFDGQKFTGKIDNTPQQVKNVAAGQDYSVAKNEIIDWVYMKDGVAVGNRTLKAMLPRMKPEEAAKITKALGWK